MSDNDTLYALIGFAVIACGCIAVLLAVGVGAFLLFRRKKPSPAAAAPAVSVPTPPGDARSALLALSDPQKPYVVRVEGNKAILAWNVVDAVWLEQLNAKGLSKDYRLEITLDDANHVARFLEFDTQTDTSVGADGVSASKSFFKGRNLMKKEFSFQFGPGGGYAYAFDADVVKKEARQALKAAGWTVKE